MTREEELILFLKKHGWNSAKRIALESDASKRTYERLVQNEESAILMNSPQSERPGQFVFIDTLLRQAGVHAPKILAEDIPTGFILLEDFGDKTFTRLLNEGADELSLYKKGIDALIQLQKNIRLPADGITEFTFDRMMNEVMLLPNWFGTYCIKGGLTEEAKAAFISIWTPLLEKLVSLPKTLVLLDYHADNLMVTPSDDCGVLDFQDARIGPVSYDLMSLLEDERRDVSEEVRRKLTDYYFTAMPEMDQQAIRETLPIITMQRHTKVIGIFVRLFMRDKKEKYLDMIPLVWKLTERHLSEPIFTEYKNWLDKYIPTEARHTIKPEVSS